MPTSKAGYNIGAPLYVVLGHIAALWVLANLGYYIILPVLGFQLSYNSAPFAIAAYFLFWAGVSVWYFWDLFRRWLSVDSRLWVYGALSLGYATLLWALLYLFAHLPALQGVAQSTYTDLLLATPWYFLPKATEILVQQTLNMALVLDLDSRFHSLKSVVIGYSVCFGGAHVVLFLLNGAPTLHATIMTTGALLSGLVFPYLILRVKEGFVYTYMIHFIFYIILGLILHTWPLIGYGA